MADLSETMRIANISPLAAPCLLLIVAIAACSTPAPITPAVDASVDATSAGDSGTLVDGGSVQDTGILDSAGALVAQGAQVVAACSATGPGTETCKYEFKLDPAKCAGAKCKKMAIFFAGGQQTCTQSVLDAYSSAGYVAVCALLFETSTATGLYPYHAEAPRVDTVVRAITSDANLRAAWSGEELLFTGVSHGATAPVLAMARTKSDDAAAWKGTTKTGACFFDGIYNIAALDTFLATGNAGAPCLGPPAGILSHARAMGRYYGAEPLSHACGNGKCACDPNHSPDIDLDTSETVAATEFAVRNWKLIECGSAMPACSADVTPAAPIQALCTKLDASPDHTCVYDTMPTSSHLTCATAGIDKCRTWFDALP
jgi:hypothetical protein